MPSPTHNDEFKSFLRLQGNLVGECNGRTGRTHIDQAHVCIYTPQHRGAIALAPIHAHFPILVGSHL